MRRASALLERLAAPPVRATQERYRHELKYLINEGEHAALACRMAPVFKLDKHARAGGYTIRSLYFDDYCNSAYEEKDAGILMRKKYRVRIYNGSDKVIKLERKKKYGSWIYKEDAPLTRGEFELFFQPQIDGKTGKLAGARKPRTFAFIVGRSRCRKNTFAARLRSRL